ncbi:MAG: GNAT family N-acetyltransferase [Muribaculaceae bacterium]|nr:GNAT family N-acetyltransferase [Muribaculaceae bacterium]
MPAPGIPNIINCGICTLHPAQHSNVRVVEELFKYPDVRKFYVLRDDHAANIKNFCQYIIAANIQKTAMNFIICDKQGNEVGLISAEPMMNRNTNLPMWNVGYAVLPSERRKGYAYAALNGLTNFLLQNYSFPHVMLDICTENHESEGVARKCGFTKPNDGQGYIDPNHMELGFRFRWFKQLAGQRTMYFNQAVHCYRQKNYAGAVKNFQQALNEPYQPGTPYSDAQIYSNLGMALSSVHLYREALDALKKAQSLGLNNPSIEKELLWLRNNKGLY